MTLTAALNAAAYAMGSIEKIKKADAASHGELLDMVDGTEQRIVSAFQDALQAAHQELSALRKYIVEMGKQKAAAIDEAIGAEAEPMKKAAE